LVELGRVSERNEHRGERLPPGEVMEEEAAKRALRSEKSIRFNSNPRYCVESFAPSATSINHTFYYYHNTTASSRFLFKPSDTPHFIPNSHFIGKRNGFLWFPVMLKNKNEKYRDCRNVPSFPNCLTFQFESKMGVFEGRFSKERRVCIFYLSLARRPSREDVESAINQ
jgi:hypothetical protein